MSSESQRPRLADDVIVRQHVAGDDAWVTVHRGSSGVLLRLGPREGAVILAADGTRDSAGIALAVRRRGVKTNVADVEEMFDQLRAKGLVVDGPPDFDPETVAVGVREPDLPGDRKVVALPGYRFHCDGRGGCCSQYGAVLLTPPDRSRALAAFEGHRIGPWPIEHAFVPQHGSAPAPVRVATTRDGGCMFLDADGKCGIHRRAGADAKPSGCRLFPMRLVDDGERVRASAVTECRCVLAEPGELAEPMVADGIRVEDVPPMAVIRRLPDRIPIRSEHGWTRAEARTWSLAAVETLRESKPVDMARWCWEEAHRLDERLPFGEVSKAIDSFAALRTLTATTLRELEQSRPDAEGLLRSLRWVALSAALLADAELFDSLLEDPPEDGERERLCVSLMLWGFVGLGRTSLPTWLRDRAVRLWLARAMASTRSEIESDPSLDLPITVVDAMMRGYGLSDYRDVFDD